MNLLLGRLVPAFFNLLVLVLVLLLVLLLAPSIVRSP
jgi:hypothetical protein